MSSVSDRSIERGHVERPVNTEETQLGRLLITTTPATSPDAKPLCGGTARSSLCFPCLPATLREQSRAEMAWAHWGALSRSWLEVGHPASKARGRASNLGVPPKLTFFLCRRVSTNLDLPTRPHRRLSLSKTARDRQKHYLLQLNDLVVHVFLLSVDQGPRNVTWRVTCKV